ncbi:alpha-amylase family glycosyl hydrolase [Paucibacter soli]|uniref:alpha-amylase family glycosyl hydrolase n=1 Tax=Paucibacter soli TaxID=3133433 RepID=UPI003097B2BE
MMKQCAPLKLLSLGLALAAATAHAAPVDLSPVPQRPSASPLRPGWAHGAFMEIFVRGYHDSDGDGIGDLRGLTQRLDYLKELGIKGIWLMPIFSSADHDHGYATTDFRSIEPAYGSLADFDELIKQAHARGIGVIIDYILNHSAQAHPLFAEARASKASPYRDWFVWREPSEDLKDWDIWGQNPWYAEGGSHYFGTFGPHMPDFNLRNPAVVAYHGDSLRFWLNRGLDGYRLDAVPHLIENNARDWNDQPESRRLTGDFSRLIRSYARRHVVCEATAEPKVYAAPSICGSAFAFGLEGKIVKAAKGDAEAIKAVGQYFESAPLDMATMLSNHDIFAGARAWDQFGGNEAQYKLAAATYLLLPGTPFIYYGEEVGMAGVPGLAGDEPLRSPMSWSADASGFSRSETPFRPASPNAASHNAQQQQADPNSILNFYKAMLRLRNGRPELTRGSYRLAFADGQVLGFERRLGGRLSLVLINYGEQARQIELGPQPGGLTRQYPTAATRAQQGRRFELPPQSVQVFSSSRAK